MRVIKFRKNKNREYEYTLGDFIFYKKISKIKILVILKYKINFKNMEIRTLELDDVSEDYVSWFFHDKDVIKYSDNRYKVFSLDGQRDYVKNCLNDKNILLLGIFVDNKHIGNIILNGIVSVHKRAEVSYLIGDKYYWGKGIGKSAVARVISLAKQDLKLNKLFA